MNTVDFILRIYTGPSSWFIDEISSITVSNITLISKPQKFGGVCMHKGNQKKFNYTIELSKEFNRNSGSHSYPNLTFKGKFIDIIVKNFPRYPCFAQDNAAARGCLNGYGYTNYMNKGFAEWIKERKVKFLTLQYDSN